MKWSISEIMAKKSQISSLCVIISFLFVILIIIWSILFVSVVSDVQFGFGFPELSKISIFGLSCTQSQYDSTLTGYSYRDYWNNSTSGNFKGERQVPGLTFFRLGELLSNWNPDDVSIEKWETSPAHPNHKHGLTRFNYQNSQDMLTAQKYREAEIPFVIYNMPEMEKASQKYFNLENMVNQFGSMPRMVEKSKDNHFMYYSGKVSVGTSLRYPEWTPPQTEVPMTFSKFLREVQHAEDRTTSIVPPNISLYYLTLSASEGKKTPWIRAALPFFAEHPPVESNPLTWIYNDLPRSFPTTDPHPHPDSIPSSSSSPLSPLIYPYQLHPNQQKDPTQENFFIIDPEGFKGIACRFGMKGVISAAHYDGGRNFIAMLRGRKRYLLLPPQECDHLSLLPKGHPSGRHSSIDWSSSQQVQSLPELYNAQATEYVLKMGEILYLPSYWFHYIVSQDASVQCNARSGNDEIGREPLRKCGFYSGEKEKKWVQKQNQQQQQLEQQEEEEVEEEEAVETEEIERDRGEGREGGLRGKTLRHSHHEREDGRGDRGGVGGDRGQGRGRVKSKGREGRSRMGGMGSESHPTEEQQSALERKERNRRDRTFLSPEGLLDIQ